MGDQFGYLKELGTQLYGFSKSKLLCDMVVMTEGGREVFAHSVMLAAVSSKLKVAFEHFGGAKRNSMFRLNLTECSHASVEAVIQFIYTGTVPVMYHLDDINKFLFTGQKLGLDSSKLGLCLAIMMTFADPSYFQSPFVITDEDIYLELFDKDHSPATAIATEVIKLTSKVAGNQKLAGQVPDHSYTQYPEKSTGAGDTNPGTGSACTAGKPERERPADDVDLGEMDAVAMVTGQLDADDPSALQEIVSHGRT